eukprot:4288003-Amphidinium_carterae.1
MQHVRCHGKSTTVRMRRNTIKGSIETLSVAILGVIRSSGAFGIVSSLSKAGPAPWFTTLGDGQPKFKSTP